MFTNNINNSILLVNKNSILLVNNVTTVHKYIIYIYLGKLCFFQLIIGNSLFCSYFSSQQSCDWMCERANECVREWICPYEWNNECVNLRMNECVNECVCACEWESDVGMCACECVANVWVAECVGECLSERACRRMCVRESV